jgi:NAD(P)-dependent dehydrogenase (short-subunit alcohol dehydrogenase family)
MCLENKTAVVTGGASGIGQAIAEKLSENGADVVIADNRIDPASQVAEDIASCNADTLAVKTDVSNADDVDKLVTETIDEFGHLDILVNNAGTGILKPITELTESDWDHVLDVNLKGTFLCTRRAAQEMLPQESGKVINIASVAGVTTGSITSAAYSASKAGIINFTRVVGRELAPKGINVNAIGPGVVEGTRLTKPLLSDEDQKEEMERMTATERFGEPEDIAGAAVYLASEKADFVVGETIFVDGGWLTL